MNNWIVLIRFFEFIECPFGYFWLVLSATSSNYSKNIGFSATSSGNEKSQFSEAATTASVDENYPNGQVLAIPNLRVFSFAELKSATKNFKSDTVLGEGGFGKVFKGWVDEKTLAPSKFGIGMMVAIKKLNHESVQGFQEWQVIFFRLSKFYFF